MVGIAGALLAGGAGGAAVNIVINAIDNTKGALASVNKNLLGIGVAAGVAGLAIGVAFAKTVPGARDLAEETSKLNTIFDEIGTERLERNINNLGRAYILSSRETTRLLASTGDLLTGLGFTQDSAFELSQEVLSLGSDLASFNNFQGGAAGAARILERALLGERESLKSLGISILESDVKNQLLIDGTSELTGLALKQARANATLTLVMEQSKNAMGDTARTADSLANRQRELTRQVTNLSDSIGTLLIPVALKITNLFIGIVSWFNKLSKTQKKWIVVAVAVGAVLLVIGGALAIIGAVLPLVATGIGVVTAVSLPWLLIIGAIILAIAALIAINWWLIKNMDKVKAEFEKVGVVIQNIMIGVHNAVISVWNGIVNYIQKSINRIVSMVNSVIRSINKIPGVDFDTFKKVNLGRFQGSMMTPISTGNSGTTVINIANVNGLTGKDMATELQGELNNVIVLN